MDKYIQDLSAARAHFEQVSVQVASEGRCYSAALLEADEAVMRAKQAAGIQQALNVLRREAARTLPREQRGLLVAAVEAICHLAAEHAMPGLAVCPELRARMVGLAASER